MNITIKFTLDHSRDSEIINYMDGMSSVKRNRLIKELLLENIYKEMDKVTLTERLHNIETKLDDLIARPRFGTVDVVPKQQSKMKEDSRSISEDELSEIRNNIMSLGD